MPRKLAEPPDANSTNSAYGSIASKFVVIPDHKRVGTVRVPHYYTRNNPERNRSKSDSASLTDTLVRLSDLISQPHGMTYAKVASASVTCAFQIRFAYQTTREWADFFVAGDLGDVNKGSTTVTGTCFSTKKLSHLAYSIWEC